MNVKLIHVTLVCTNIFVAEFSAFQILPLKYVIATNLSTVMQQTAKSTLHFRGEKGDVKNFSCSGKFAPHCKAMIG